MRSNHPLSCLRYVRDLRRRLPFRRRGHQVSLSWATHFVWLALSTLILFLAASLFAMKSSPATYAQAPLDKLVEKVDADTYKRALQEQLPGEKGAGTAEPLGFLGVDVVLDEVLFPFHGRNGAALLARGLPGFSRVTSAGDSHPERAEMTETPDPPPALVQAAEREYRESAIPASTQGKKVVFIYHTHNREAYLPELPESKRDNPYDAEKNITLVGKRLAQSLEKKGIGAEVSTKDYWNELGGKYALSYALSRKEVQAALAQNPDFIYVFDVHRDSVGKAVEIDGKRYAAIAFVLGQGNQNWEKNQAFAQRLHDKLEELYPGISRGIKPKGEKSGHGEYNQSVHPNSILVEIGGVTNTLEEAYNAADALAEAIAALYWDAEAVSSPVSQ